MANQSLPPGFVIVDLPAGFVIEEEEELGAVTEPDDPRLGYPSLDDMWQGAKSGAAGFTKSFQDPLYGAADFAGLDVEGYGPLSKSARKRALETMEEEADKSVGGAVGEGVGTMTQFMLPGAMATKVAPLVKGLPMTADILGAGTRGAMVAPDEGETRLEGAAQEAALAATGYAGGKVAHGLLAGMKKRPGVEEFFDAGGYLTPGQAGQSTLVRGLETVSEVTPFLAKGVGEMKGKAEASISRAFMNRIGKSLGTNIDEGGQAGFAQVKGVVNQAYDDAWRGIDDLVEAERKIITDGLKAESKMWGDIEAKSLLRLRRDIKNENLGFKQIDKKIRDQIESTNDYDFREFLKGERASLRELAGDEVQTALQKIDAIYPDFLTIQDAAQKSRFGEFAGATLEQSMRKIGGTRAAVGQAPSQEIIENVALAMENVGGQPLDFFRRVAKFAPTPMPRIVMKKLGNIVIGETKPQRAMGKEIAELAMQYPELAEAIRRAFPAGAATYGEMN